MPTVTEEDTYDFKRLFYMACGYISASKDWENKNPMEVVDFFLKEYKGIDS